MTITPPARYPGADSLALIGRRLRGSYDIDEWGLDPELIALTEPVGGLRWDIRVVGAEQLPMTGGALLVFNRHVGISEPWVISRGVRRSSGRFVRTVGVPDIAPVGPLLRRFGAVAARPEEIAGLLRAGQLVGLPTAASVGSAARAGALEPAILAQVDPADTPVFPTALIGREWGRSWTIVIGAPIDAASLGGIDGESLARRARSDIESLLDDALPDRWW